MPDEDRSVGTLADAEAALRKGRGGSLIVIGALGVVLAAGLVLLIGGDDQARVYGEIGKHINGLKRAHFDQFWSCALPGENIADLRSNTELSAKLDVRGQERGRAYGVYLRDRCMPKLEQVGPELEALIVPDDLQPDVRALTSALGQLRSSVSEYVVYLDDAALQYDAEQAGPRLGQITRAWYDFKKAHNAVNARIKTKLK